MALPLAPLIAAGASLLGTGGQIYAQAKMNKKTIKYNKEMYEKQKADNLANWNLQNSYDSPEAQMARYKEAGLNPNLVYSQNGQGGGTLATPDVKSADQHTPDVQSGIANSMQAYMSTTMQKEQINNLKKQQDVLSADALLKAAQTLSTLTSNEKGKLDVKLLGSTLGYDIDAKKLAVQAALASIKKTQADTINTQTNTTATAAATERANQLQPGALQKQIADIASVKMSTAKTAMDKKQVQKQIELMNQSKELNEFEIMLNKKGFTKSDDVKWRIGNQLWNDISGGKSIKEAIKDATDKLKNAAPPGQKFTDKIRGFQKGFFGEK